MRLLPILAVAVVTALPAGQVHAAPDRFDLECQLVETTSAQPNETFAFSRSLSIDLAAGEFCFRGPEFGCKEIERLNNVTDTSFDLADIDDEAVSIRTVIDRRTWTWDNEARTKQLNFGSSHSKGACTLADFTPFPATAVRK